MRLQKPKKHQPELSADTLFADEYAELDAALDTRAAAAQELPIDGGDAAGLTELSEDTASAPTASQPTAEITDACLQENSASDPAPAAQPVAAESDPENPQAEEAAPQGSPSTESPSAESSSGESQTVPEPVKESEAQTAQEPVPASGDAEPIDSSASEKDKKAKKKLRKDARKQLKKSNKKEKKKGRFITPLILLGIVLAVVGACVWNVFYCMHHFEVNFYQIESTHVTSDLRIAVISDVHLSEYGEDNRELVDAVRALNPDLIISAGDLVTYGEKDYDNMLSLCRQLVDIAPTYGVMGNHEDEKTYLEHDEEMRQKFKDTGMILLVNRCEKIRIRNNDIELVGVSGSAEGFDLYGGKATMEKLEEHSTALRICVAHVPTLFKERLEDYDFDIGIAGHTHGGLIRLPMIGGLYSVEEGFRPEYDGGLYRLDNGATLFVSRGLGNSGKIPRFNNTPELAVIDVRWY